MPLNNFGISYVTSPNDTFHTKLAGCAQPDRVGFLSLYELGFDKIYKLNTNDEYADKDEISNFKGDVILMPYPPLWKIPAKDIILGNISEINNDLQSGFNVVVHCTHGKDRTRFIIACFQILYNNWTFEQAMSERAAYGDTDIRDEIFDKEYVTFLKQLK